MCRVVLPLLPVTTFNRGGGAVASFWSIRVDPIQPGSTASFSDDFLRLHRGKKYRNLAGKEPKCSHRIRGESDVKSSQSWSSQAEVTSRDSLVVSVSSAVEPVCCMWERLTQQTWRRFVRKKMKHVFVMFCSYTHCSPKHLLMIQWLEQLSLNSFRSFTIFQLNPSFTV